MTTERKDQRIYKHGIFTIVGVIAALALIFLIAGLAK